MCFIFVCTLLTLWAGFSAEGVLKIPIVVMVVMKSKKIGNLCLLHDKKATVTTAAFMFSTDCFGI